MVARSKGLPRGSLMSPNWSQLEMDSVQSILSLRKSNSEEVGSDLSYFLKRKEDADIERRRCRSEVNLQNSIVSLETAKASHEKLTSNFWAFEAEIELLRLEPHTSDFIDKEMTLLKLRSKVINSDTKLRHLKSQKFDVQDLEYRRRESL